MAKEVTESQPFKSLKELYDNVGNLPKWPDVKSLRECTDYAYNGSQLTDQKLSLEKIDRQEQPRTLLCHDMKGGYLEDRFIDGSKIYDSYLFYHWSVVDTFIYFSHYFISVPPYGWINAAHDHGVKVLGTIITEREGIWNHILESEEEARKFADAVIFIAKFYKFDGWLLNVENVIKEEQISKLIDFLKYLTDNIHQAIRDSEIIWYDSVTINGTLNWQNELNNKNVEFFLNCDGIYLNYNWTQSKLENSCKLAKQCNRSIYDIYVGLDVWGRGCPGGGGFNSAYALSKIRKNNLSVAIFGPGWTHEYFGPETFQEMENIFWAQLFPYLYVHVPIYEREMFKTSFCHGSGKALYRYGKIQMDTHIMAGKNTFGEISFYNLSMQKPQISVPIPYLQFTRMPQMVESKDKNEPNKDAKNTVHSVYETKRNIIRILQNNVKLEDKMPILDVNSFEFCTQFAFEGGGCLKLITNDLQSYHRLFLIHIEFERDIEATIVYEEAESLSSNGSQNGPILMLRNDTGLRSITHFKMENLNSKWTRWYANIKQLRICKGSQFQSVPSNCTYIIYMKRYFGE